MAQTTAATDTKKAHINLRTRAQDKELIERAAKLRGLKVSSFILPAAIEQAKQVLENAGMMILDDDDRQAFVSAFLETHEATPYMKRAIKAHKQS